MLQYDDDEDSFELLLADLSYQLSKTLFASKIRFGFGEFLVAFVSAIEHAKVDTWSGSPAVEIRKVMSVGDDNDDDDSSACRFVNVMESISNRGEV